MSYRRLLVGLGASVVLLATTGCRQDMHDQAKKEAYESSTFFADGRSARPPVEGTVARGAVVVPGPLETGYDASGNLLTELPMPLSRELLERGHERYNIFCSPCHATTGDGNGMIVRRGFKRPESFQSERLLASEIGYFFDVMTNGFGQMSSYAAQVPVEDRWAIAAYVRTLQFSQTARLIDLPQADREAVVAGLSVNTTDESSHGDDHGEEGH